MALTLDHLATLPKRDKDRFISSFAQEQQRFYKQYLYEGQRATQSWDYSEPMSPTQASPKNDPRLGFGTPVLRARLDLVSKRISCPNGTGRDKTPRGQESSKENERPSGHGAKLPDAAKQKEGSQKKNSSKAGKKRSKEHNLRSDSDNESVQRLADRRQRRKTKRDIMDPKSSVDSDNEAKPSNTCKNRKQTKRQSKLRQEFALMHGFSSTNVGKNRLTLNPGLRDIGVFQKGRASRKTDVIQSGKRKRQDTGFLFSEATFLNKSRQKVSKIDFQKVAKISTTREEDSTIASSASMRSTQARTDSDMVKVRRKFKGNKMPSQSNLVSKTKPQNEDKAQTGYNPADSIVWDIEEAELLGSEVSSGAKQGSIVLEIDHLPSTSNEVPENEALDANTTALEAHLKSSQQKSLSVTQSDAHSSPSLSPFQSASQIGLKTVDVVSLPTVPSKYFKPLPQKLAEPHYTINQLDTKPPPTLSELEKLSTVEDTIPQAPEPASHLHRSVGLSVRSYCDGQEGRPNFLPSMQSSYDLEVSLYCEGYPDSEFWLDHPGDLGAERLDDMDNILDHVSDGQTNSHVVIPADDEIWTLDYVAGGELGEKDHTLFIPLSGYQSMELPNSIAPSLWLSDAYSDVSERCQEIAYQDSEGGKLPSIDLGSEDQQTQSDGDLNLEHEEVLSTDLEPCPDVVHHFWQGRSLLYGLNPPGDSSSLHKLSNVEADVARQLQLNHWQPQKL